jgi:hypothetical protein
MTATQTPRTETPSGKPPLLYVRRGVLYLLPQSLSSRP